MRVRLTKTAIDGARYQGPGADYRWDTKTAGFGIRVYPSGRKAFVVTYRVRGKQRFQTLGRFGEMTVQKAEAEALLVRGRARMGEDPGLERRGYRSAPTVEDLARRYMDEHARPSKKPRSAADDADRWRLHILPPLCGGGDPVAAADRLPAGRDSEPALG